MITPETLVALEELGVSDEKLAELRTQMYRAYTQRNQAGPEGRQAGGIYTAANPMEHIAGAINRYRGGRGMERAQGGIDKQLAAIKSAKGQLYQDIMLQQMRQQPQQPQMQQDPRQRFQQMYAPPTRGRA